MAHLDLDQPPEYSGDEYEPHVQQPLSLQEQKDELKRKLMGLSLKGNKQKKEKQLDGNMPPDLGKFKLRSADDAKYVEMHDGTKSKMNLNDFQFISTLGTGTFGRVRLVRHNSEGAIPMALKCLKKSEIIRLK